MKLTPVITKRKEATHYLCVNLRKDGYNEVYKVHRLVAEAFIPNPNNLPIPNHIDGTEASRITGLGRGSISHCLNGRQESYMGYIWEYK